MIEQVFSYSSSIFREEVRQFIDLAYSNDINGKREAINKINQLETRLIVFISLTVIIVDCLFYSESMCYQWVLVL